MKILESIIKFIIWVLSCIIAEMIISLAFEFISQEPDITKWHWVTRLIFLVSVFIGTIGLGGSYIDEVEEYFAKRLLEKKENEKDK